MKFAPQKVPQELQVMERRCSLLALLFPACLTTPGCSIEIFPVFVISTNSIPVLHWIICIRAATWCWRKWCQENQLESEFLIKEPLSPSLVTPWGHSLCFALLKLFRTVIGALDRRLDKHTRNLGFEKHLQPSPQFGQMLIGTGTLMSPESHPCPWEETGACRKLSQE